MSFYATYGKRLLDVGIAVPMLAASVPLMCAAGVLVGATIGRPIFFKQNRAGRDGVPFKLYKLRTMSDARDASGALLPDDKRLTALGAFLRKTSMDELPQLVNVIRGEMSLVGPRPLLLQYTDRYSPEQRRRLDVKPGITGWAQINGRNALSWEEKFAHDVWYVDHVTFKTDLQILARTALKVIRRDGISASAHATMPEFMGTGARN
jgi:sugar transferase EpsL